MTTTLMTWHELFDGALGQWLGWDRMGLHSILGWIGVLHSVVLGSFVPVMHLHIDARNDKNYEYITRT